MLAAARISNEMGILDKSELIRLRKVIENAGLPTEVPGIEAERLIRVMKHDKKVLRDKIRFVLLKSIGSAFVTDKVSPSLLEKVLVNEKA